MPTGTLRSALPFCPWPLVFRFPTSEMTAVAGFYFSTFFQKHYVKHTYMYPPPHFTHKWNERALCTLFFISCLNKCWRLFNICPHRDASLFKVSSMLFHTTVDKLFLLVYIIQWINTPHIIYLFRCWWVFWFFSNLAILNSCCHAHILIGELR